MSLIPASRWSANLAHRILFCTLVSSVAVGSIGTGVANAQPLERARSAQARGDLRTAQIEYRNAARSDPQSGAIRAALAAASLDLGDADTAQKEAQAALDRGYDQAAGTALLLRTLLAQNRFGEILRGYPLVEAPDNAAVAGQIAAGRAMAQLGLGDLAAARASVAAARRLAPVAAEPMLAAASLATAEGDRTAAEAAIDLALANDPDRQDALLRKAVLRISAGDNAGAKAALDRVISLSPANAAARVTRAGVFLQEGDDVRAQQDVNALLRSVPGSVPGNYLRAVLQSRARDFVAADQTLQRLSGQLNTIPEGLLLLATVKRALNQPGVAEDAAQRYFARQPTDARGAMLLATIQMERNRPDAAAGTLTQHVARGGNSAAAYEMLGRAHLAARRPREAVQAFTQAVAAAPQDAAIQTRLAAARLAAGDSVGSSAAAEEALRLNPDQAGAQQLAAISALARGDVVSAQAEWEKLSPAARRSPAGGTLEGLLLLLRLDFAGAKTAFEQVLRQNPDHLGSLLGLARVAAAAGNPVESERLFGEVLRRSPGNTEAIGRLASLALSDSPRATAALAVLVAAQTAAPAQPTLAQALASILIARGDASRAKAVLDTASLRAPGQPTGIMLVRSQAFAALGEWTEAEAASRVALAEDPTSIAVRRQLIGLMLRAGNRAGAEALAQEAVRIRPGDPAAQQMLVSLIQQTQGLDAALALADQLARRASEQPASLQLRGDLLMLARRPADAARAYAEAYGRMPSSTLALRQSAALQLIGQAVPSEAPLRDWLERAPNDPLALSAMAQVDIQAGRLADAERRLSVAAEQAPENGLVLNNLAWLIGERGTERDLARARPLAERAYFQMPNAETADTLGWILARYGEAPRAVTLLRQSLEARRNIQLADPARSFRLAYALSAAGQREEAVGILQPLLANAEPFAGRPDAERLLSSLRSGR